LRNASANSGWRLYVADIAALAIREWKGEVAIFNKASGDTHLLNSVAGMVLQTLVHGPRATTEIVTALAQSKEHRSTALRGQQITEALSLLRRLGLITGAGE
jgi:PqqD family protein of HPr-rel-A system